MPEISRQNTRFLCAGVDLVAPVDKMPPGSFRALTNVRVVSEGRIEGRPGYGILGGPYPANPMLHSIRRLNDIPNYFNMYGWTYVVGAGKNLLAGIESQLTQIDTGYSGNPLSLIPFQPESSPSSWMYVFDSLKSSKVRPDGMIRGVGIPPPTKAPVIELGVPASVVVNEGNSASGWTASGTAGAITAISRSSSSVAPTVNSIKYVSGTTGWCCIQPTLTSGNWAWVGERMRIVLNSGGANSEIVVLRNVLPAIESTTVQGISYDSGTSGICSIVLSGNPTGLDRNSLLQIDSEVVRVLAVVLSPDGLSYSIRCNTSSTHVIGSSVIGLLSWFCYTVLGHLAAESISTTYLFSDVTGSGDITGTQSLLSSIDCSIAGGRPVTIADDYMHFSFYVGTPSALVSLTLTLDIDPNTTSLANAFQRNYLTFTIPASQINQSGPGATSVGDWTELLIPLAQGVRYGNDITRGLANIAAIQVSVALSGASSFGFDDWYIFGTYGPVIPPSSPEGYEYYVALRDSTTGAKSVPSPITMYQLYPIREQVVITPQTSTVAGVDSLDIYRLGGTLTTWGYVGTAQNNIATPQSFTDTTADLNLSTLTGDPTQVQPWPVLQNVWAGTCNVVGTTVIWASGTQFNTALLANTQILINGVSYLTYGQPASTTRLQIQATAGVQTNVSFVVASPTLAGQPLPFVFGPLEGPFAPVTFALGDPDNPGRLYYSNGGSLDAADSANYLDLTSPSELLISGAVWNGLVIVGSRDNLFVIRYSYLATIGASQNTTFQFQRIPAATGIWCPWCCARGPDGVYFLGRDGIYKATETGCANISDAKLYPLFPHDGEIAFPVNGYNPVDMTQTAAMRLTYLDQAIEFTYYDTAGNQMVLRYEIPQQRWFFIDYADAISVPYLVEDGSNIPNSELIILLSATQGYLYQCGGNVDNGSLITSRVDTPAFDNGDERLQKLYVDVFHDYDGSGTLNVAGWYDNYTVPISTPNTSFGVSGRSFGLQYLSTLGNLTLHRNIAFSYTWTGGPGGPRIYGVEPAAYPQPYMSTFMVSQVINLSFPGWKHHRRLYAGYISTAPLWFSIQTQDGRLFGPYILPTTNGVFRIVPMMLDQGIKDLAFAYQLDGRGQQFALFPEAFTIELKEWVEDTYVELAVFKT